MDIILTPRSSIVGSNEGFAAEFDKYFEEDDRIMLSKSFNEENTERLQRNINFLGVAVRVFRIKGVENKEEEEKSIQYLYYLNLEEYYQNGEMKTIVRVVKKWSDFKELHHAISNIYRGLDLNIPKLPKEKIGPNVIFLPKEKKIQLEEYFEKLLELPKVECNENFQSFFYLAQIGQTLEFYRDKLEVFDYSN